MPRPGVTRETVTVARLASVVWWTEFPLFAALVSRVTFERGCRDANEALASLMRSQGYAVTIAVIYISAYVWLTGAMLLRARARTSTGGWPAISNRERCQFLLMAGFIAIDQSPRVIWAAAYSLAGLCR
jgi:hypothetical protein